MTDIQKIEDIIRRNKFTSLFPFIESLRDLQQQPGTVDVAVLGQFKAGKSSFLNHLFEIAILPTGVTPVTSVITRLKFGAELKVIVRFQYGKVATISPDELAGFISEKNNPSNIKQVGIVDIELPALFPYKNLRVIDTPGIGSIFKHNTETTENWFSKIGIAVIAVSSERPLSADDISLIRDIEKHCPKVVLLLTKTDLVTLPQLEEICAYIKSSLAEQLNRHLDIFTYSVKPEAVSLNGNIRQLLGSLSSDSENNFDEIVKHKTLSIAQSCKALLQIIQKTALHDEQERTRIREAILDERSKQQYVYKELMLISSGNKGTTRESILALLAKHQEALCTSLIQKFHAEYSAWEGNLFGITEQFETWLKQELNSGFTSIINVEYEHIVQIPVSAREHFQFYIGSFTERLNANIEKVLGLKIPQINWQLSVEKLGKLDIYVSSAFDIHIDSLWFLFPMFIFKNIFERFFAKQIPCEVEKNIYRLTSDLTERINKLIDNLKNQSLKFVVSELDTVNNILSDQNSDITTIESQITILSHILNKTT
jgi:GTP-binding protein EngB required for normal cell division